MRIAIATDAWAPQINGVATTLKRTIHHLESWGHEVLVIHPDLFRTVPMPGYESIRLAVFPKRKVFRLLEVFEPQAIHISTEGPIGLAARRYCKLHEFPFTTAYHTRFPEYVRLRLPIPLALSYALLRRFHRDAEKTLVATPSMVTALEQRHFDHLDSWSRGVDVDLFRPRAKARQKNTEPLFVYMGRVAREKNIEAFLKLDLPGRMLVIGDGPELPALKKQYPHVEFCGFKTGEDLARRLAQADVFVFPSRTDTFGLVILEAMACGVPVAAYPVSGPQDIIEQGVSGVLDEDLGKAALAALKLDRNKVREQALRYSWQASSMQFLNHLAAFQREDEEMELFELISQTQKDGH